jgi:hypothetical protein
VSPSGIAKEILAGQLLPKKNPIRHVKIWEFKIKWTKVTVLIVETTDFTLLKLLTILQQCAINLLNYVSVKAAV